MYLCVDSYLCTLALHLLAVPFRPCRAGMALEYAAYFMPRRSLVCEEVLEREGVKGDIQVAEYPLDFIPFDSDVLSLEMEAAFKVGRDVQAMSNTLITTNATATAGVGTQTAGVLTACCGSLPPALHPTPGLCAAGRAAASQHICDAISTADIFRAGIALWPALQTTSIFHQLLLLCGTMLAPLA